MNHDQLKLPSGETIICVEKMIGIVSSSGDGHKVEKKSPCVVWPIQRPMMKLDIPY